MSYVGSSDNSINNDSLKPDGTSLRNFIAIRRKKKLYLFEANSITVSPYLPNHEHLQVKQREAPKTHGERRQAAIDLVKAFGSKKKRLTYERLEKQHVDSTHMNESINTATQSALMPGEDEMPDRKDTTVLELVPPCNRDTKDLHQVYLLKDILTENDLNDMEYLAEQWLNCNQQTINTWKAEKIFSDYFFEMKKKLHGKSDFQSVRKAKMVLYTELLICLLKLKFQEVRKKTPNLPKEFPSWLKEKALDSFTSMNANNLR